VTDWQLIWIGTIAIAMVITTIMQVALLAVAIKLALQATRAAQDLRRQVQPLIEKANKITDDAARATALAVTQVERVDAFMSHTVERVDEVLDIVHASILQPIRQGTAIIAAIKAALAVFGKKDDRGRTGRDDEDALFIG
jgi:biopolymer transport protein ExbB/TolQ